MGKLCWPRFSRFSEKTPFFEKNKYSKNHNSAKNGFKRLGFLVKLANYAQIGIMGVKKFWVNFASQDLAVFLKKRLFSKKKNIQKIITWQKMGLKGWDFW